MINRTDYFAPQFINSKLDILEQRCNRRRDKSVAKTVSSKESNFMIQLLLDKQTFQLSVYTGFGLTVFLKRILNETM